MVEEEILTGKSEACITKGYQSARICLPVKVTPYAHLGKCITKCCGDPVIREGCSCNICEGSKNGSCMFTVTQDICVTIPITFGADVEAGTTYVRCRCATVEDICTDTDEKECED